MSYTFKIWLLTTSFLVFFVGSLPAQSKEETAIRNVLKRQVNDWNLGNIENYMQGYWKSDSLVFVGKNGIRQGYTSTLESYKKGYPDTTAMGKLNFELLQLKRLSANYYFVTGKWHLQRTIGDLKGYFTLLLKKIKRKWLIVADHSS